MGRQPCCDKVGLKRGPWTIEEDHKLMSFILNNGIQCWRMVPKLAGLLRCGKSCRLRWINYLRPDLKRGALSEVEENQIIQLHSRLGNRWSKIASHFPGRTDNEIKNHWNTRIKKRLKQLGLDPVTHKPMEEKDEVSEKNDTVPDLASSKQQEESNGERGDTLDTVQEKQTGGEMTSHEASTDDLLNEMLGGSSDLELGLLMNQQTKTSSNTYSPSFSLEDSLNPSMGESSSLQDDCLQQWVDCTVDSLLLWDSLNHLEQELFFLENSH
ncbi:hypothetical protein PVL29_019057 [Vitis rotundifolia]|uniref:Uncharacterized protein n=1 Tax=Vitis rotundifolia TaxID=103349 RepID=A0AA39DGL4_VITRO|nr:hypothetical protein PVL29_019057 [Vitis rotundifolia]